MIREILDELNQAIRKEGEHGREAKERGDEYKLDYHTAKQNGLIHAWSIVKQYEED